MIKLSELKDDAKVVDERGNVEDVIDVKYDVKHGSFNNVKPKFYTTMAYRACIDARNMLESAIESEDDNMYEDWYERILNDVTDEDVEKIQIILDGILSRNPESNTAYYQGKEIDIFN
ncbi:MAG TPA: hypothetical protein GX707_16725 [Epulopiscium sp.]|nr:hypothetical protein [Candidatus Epulonipiscium sp.]